MASKLDALLLLKSALVLCCKIETELTEVKTLYKIARECKNNCIRTHNMIITRWTWFLVNLYIVSCKGYI